jgi:hypothetical protein
MSSSSETDFETDALARYILRSIYLATDGRPMERCKLSSIPQVTVKAVAYAVGHPWIELKGDYSVCLTDEGRRLAIKEANWRTAT